MAEKVVDEAIEEAGGLLNRLTDMEVEKVTFWKFHEIFYVAS